MTSFRLWAELVRYNARSWTFPPRHKSNVRSAGRTPQRFELRRRRGQVMRLGLRVDRVDMLFFPLPATGNTLATPGARAVLRPMPPPPCATQPQGAPSPPNAAPRCGACVVTTVAPANARSLRPCCVVAPRSGRARRDRLATSESKCISSMMRFCMSVAATRDRVALREKFAL